MGVGGIDMKAETTGGRDPGKRPWADPSVLAGGGVLLLSFLLYLATLAPTVVWGDSAIFAVKAVSLNLTVAADSHPLYVVLGHLFASLPFEPAYSLNLLTAATASLAVLMVFLIVLELTGDAAAAVAGAAALAVSHAFWLHAVIAEVYDLNALFLLAVVLLLLKWHKAPGNRRPLFGAAFLFGMGLSNHLVLALAFPAILAFVLITDRRVFLDLKAAGLSLASFLAGISPLVFLTLQRIAHGRTAAAMADGATGGQYRKAMFVISPDLIPEFGRYLAYLFYQFPLAGFLLGAAGLAALFRNDRKKALFLILLIGVNMAFFLTFGPGAKRTTKYTFYIQDYAIFSVLVGCGSFALADLLRRTGRPFRAAAAAVTALLLLLPPALYAIAPAASKRLSVDLLHARTIPYRDNEEFFLFPGKRGYTGAAKYAEEALGTATPGAVIIADYTPFSVLRYFQVVKGVRSDVLVLDSGRYPERVPERTVSEHYGKRDIYLADMTDRYYRIAELKASYDFVPVGVLYRIERKNGAAEGAGANRSGGRT